MKAKYSGSEVCAHLSIGVAKRTELEKLGMLRKTPNGYFVKENYLLLYRLLYPSIVRGLLWISPQKLDSLVEDGTLTRVSLGPKTHRITEASLQKLVGKAPVILRSPQEMCRRLSISRRALQQRINAGRYRTLSLGPRCLRVLDIENSKY